MSFRFSIPRVILAPLSGISSLPFRTVNREAGAKFAYLEMISARSLSYQSRRTIEMMRTNDCDRPLGVQLLGKDLYYILKALERLKDYQYDLLDFNAACPQKKITAHGKGAALLTQPKKLQKILAEVVKEIKVPLVLKMRIGWDSDRDCLKIAKYAQDAGVSAVCVHGRTKLQGYRSPVNYSAIKKIKSGLKIPVIASGDIWSAPLAKKMFDQTGCDSITVARGALGNPWIFSEIKEFLSTGKIPDKPGLKEITRVMKRHLDLTIDFYGERAGTVKFRKFYIWYMRGFSKTKSLRRDTHCAKNRAQMFKLIDEFYETKQ